MRKHDDDDLIEIDDSLLDELNTETGDEDENEDPLSKDDKKYGLEDEEEDLVGDYDSFDDIDDI